MAPRPQIGDRELLLIGKILHEVSDEDLQDAGLSPDERARAEWLYDDICRVMTEKFGLAWNDVEVETV